jgi:uncharacterized protein (DUF2235 family)
MAKRLVICADGTWNVPDRIDRGQVCPSNVAKLALAVSPRDAAGRPQPIFYDKGVGTGPFDRLLGGAFGWGLSDKIKLAYQFICDQYEPGDELFLFGFSRGAYTVRSTAGLIRQCGVLKREYRSLIDDAYGLYRRRDDASHPAAVESQLFRKSYAEEVRIDFIGVWDTVGALGIPVGVPWLPVTWVHLINQRWEFHDVKLSSYVRNAYQALAIDERRPQFQPTLWEQQPQATDQTMEQVWFAGVHSNVGGGYQDHGLSDLALLWMVEKAAACGLAFDQDYLRENLAPNPLGELRDSRTGFYQKLPEAIRPIGQGPNGNEAVHRSAVERLRRAHDPGYDAPNLERYLEAGGPVVPPEAG